MATYPSVYTIDENNNNRKVIVRQRNNGVLYMITHMIVSFFAIYLSWRCNNNAFSLGPFLVALLCPHLYIIYALATHGGCGVFSSAT